MPPFIAGPAHTQERTLSNRWRISSLAVLVAAITTACGSSSSGGDTTPPPAPVATVTVTLARPSITTGQSTTATAVLRDAGANVLVGRAITWSSSAPAAATVSATGVVSAVAAGSANIIATSEGQNGSVPVTVTVAVVGSVVVSGPTVVPVGQTAQQQASVLDASGHAITGRIVTWTTSNAAFATVSPSGLVTGVGAGTVTLTATCEGVSGNSSVRIFVQGTVAAHLTATTALDQSGPPSTAVVQAPAAVVTDASGNPVNGVIVDFAVTVGGGTIVGGAATTDALGVARASSWTFGGAGAQTVHAAVRSLPSAAVDFTGLARAAADHFDITLMLISSMSDSQARAFVHAKNRIEQMIVGDIPSQPLNLTSIDLASCGGVAVSGTIDDVLILAEVGPIDGVNGILGQAGWCVLRPTGIPFPVLGHMMFDTADLDAMEAAGQLENVILHEMMHVVGFGTLWPTFALLGGGGGGADPFFTGTQARANFASLNGGSLYAGTPVPVEATGGVGTRDSHWRETVFKHELMTGWINSGVNPLSATTIGSLQDLGYVVNVGAADPFNLATAIRAAGLGVDLAPIFMGNDTRTAPPIVIGPDGRPVP
jgi:uncharacterized protein YjdB